MHSFSLTKLSYKEKGNRELKSPLPMEFDLENPFPVSEDNPHYDVESIISLFLTESDHMPSLSDLNNVSIFPQILPLISHFTRHFSDPFLPYLARNYLYRFLSSHPFPNVKPWILMLVAVSCVSLALKMRKTEHCFSNIQHDGGLIFDVQTVERMELLILGALKWRMRSITPFSFVNFFISLFEFKDPSFRKALKQRATEIIFKAQLELKLFQFRPSIMAASALLSASHELFPLQFPCFRKAISNCSYVKEDNLCRCYSGIEEIVMDGYESVYSDGSADTPINVLDWQCSGSTSGAKNTTKVADQQVTSAARLQERGFKRRKIMSSFQTDNASFQLSQVQHCL